MQNTRANQIIVEILQNALVGQLYPSSNFNPQHVVEAIAAKVEFDKTYSDSTSDNLVGIITDDIIAKRNEMKEMIETNSNFIVSDILLANFIRGKLTAYEEMLSIIKQL